MSETPSYDELRTPEGIERLLQILLAGLPTESPGTNE